MTNTPTPKHKSGIVCCFCGEAWGYVGEKPTDDILKAACDHEKVCPQNPYLKTIATLELEVSALKEQLRQRDEQLAVEKAWSNKADENAELYRKQRDELSNQLKAANELRVSGGDTLKSGVVRAFVEFPAGTPIHVVGTFGECLAAHVARTKEGK